MSDNRTKEQRRYNMQQIKGINTKPELIVRKYLFSKGFRYRLYNKNLPGKPDMVLKKYNSIIFIHGCFWHRHKNCQFSKIPQNNKAFWEDKFNKNVLRDKKHESILRKMGWNVIVIWECQLQKPKLRHTLKWLVERL